MAWSKRTDSDKYKHLYTSKRWKAMRERHLAKYPYCQCPHHEGEMIPGNTVDHKTPHKGDTRLFYDDSNLQTLTRECHNRFKASEESGGRGFNQGSDLNGFPLNKDHWWYE